MIDTKYASNFSCHHDQKYWKEYSAEEGLTLAHGNTVHHSKTAWHWISLYGSGSLQLHTVADQILQDMIFKALHP